MKPLWRRMMEGRTRHKVRVRLFPIMFTFLLSLSLDMNMGDIFDLPYSLLSHITVSRTLRSRSSASLSFVQALDFEGNKLSHSGSSSGSFIKVPGFGLSEIPEDKLLYALAGNKRNKEEDFFLRIFLKMRFFILFYRVKTKSATFTLGRRRRRRSRLDRDLEKGGTPSFKKTGIKIPKNVWDG
jgi:hypothetical protein